jgi:hypothetical protein
MGLAAHAEPLHQPRRREVEGVAAADDPVQSQPVEPRPQHHLSHRRLTSPTTTPVSRSTTARASTEVLEAG